MRGRKPVPTALKIIRGNPGKRALNRSEPQGGKPLKVAPEWLSESQRYIWQKAVKQQKNVLRETDESIFAVWVVAYDTYQRCGANSSAERSDDTRSRHERQHRAEPVAGDSEPSGGDSSTGMLSDGIRSDEPHPNPGAGELKRTRSLGAAVERSYDPVGPQEQIYGGLFYRCTCVKLKG